MDGDVQVDESRSNLTLNDSLLGLAATLCSLAVIAQSEWQQHLFTRDTEGMKRLHCLPKLVNLKHLTVDLGSICGPVPDPSFQLRIINPATNEDLFPASLQTLAIHMRWAMDDYNHPEDRPEGYVEDLYYKTLLYVLKHIRLRRYTKYPNLRLITAVMPHE